MQPQVQASDLPSLAARFRHFAEVDFRGSSPLYERLALGVADDAEMLALAANTSPSQPPTLLLFGAAQYLLLKLPDEPLAAFYPTIAAAPAPPDDPYPYFRAFCLEHRDAIIQLLTTRLVQTHEVGRCALLLPVYGIVASRTNYQPLSLVDVGCSAGLNLLWDRYAYDYGDGHFYGDAYSPLKLTCELRGDQRPPLPSHLPAVATRTGIDLNPIDLRDPDAVLWLKALIWPEHTERVVNLERAIEVLQHNPPSLLAGNALELLPQVIAETSADTVLCIYHTFSLYQLLPAAREQLSGIISAASTTRDIYWFGIEGNRDGNFVTLTCYQRGAGEETLLARCHPHGRWLEWLSLDLLR